MEASIVPGLPPYGPPAIPIPAKWGRLGREGIVVRFTPPSQPVWTANFEPGMGTITAVLPHPNLSDVVVLAKGAGYVVTPHREYQGIGVAINAYWQLHGPERLLLDHQGTEFELLDQHGIRWRTRRFSWDGIANVVVSAYRATALLTARQRKPMSGCPSK